jgi:hypothetical protein
MAGAQVAIDFANSRSFEDKAVLEFFEASGRNLVAAVAAEGVLGGIATSSADGNVVMLSPGLFQLIDEVAAVVADVALVAPRSGIVEIARPGTSAVQRNRGPLPEGDRRPGIVDDQQFPAPMRLRHDRIQRLGKQSAAAPGRQDDGNERSLRWGRCWIQSMTARTVNCRCCASRDSWKASNRTSTVARWLAASPSSLAVRASAVACWFAISLRARRSAPSPWPAGSQAGCRGGSGDRPSASAPRRVPPQIGCQRKFRFPGRVAD